MYIKNKSLSTFFFFFLNLIVISFIKFRMKLIIYVTVRQMNITLRGLDKNYSISSSKCSSISPLITSNPKQNMSSRYLLLKIRRPISSKRLLRMEPLSYGIHTLN